MKNKGLSENQKKSMRHSNKKGAGAKKRRQSHLTPKEKREVVMAEFRRGTLHSGSGQIVTDRNQAVAISYSESKSHNTTKKQLLKKLHKKHSSIKSNNANIERNRVSVKKKRVFYSHKPISSRNTKRATTPARSFSYYKRKSYPKFVETFRGKKYIVIRENNRVSRKKYDRKSYSDDIKTYKEFRSFQNPKQIKSYGKSYTFKSGTTVRYRKYIEKENRGKGVRNESRYTFYQIYVDGYVVRNRKTIFYSRSSNRHEIGYPKSKAYDEALRNFYHSANLMYLYDENEKRKYDKSDSKQQKLLRYVHSKGSEPVITDVYITYL